MGGGSFNENYPIDKKIVDLSKKKKPKLLFIPTASGDDKIYVDKVYEAYGDKLNCTCEVLYLIKEKPSKKEIENKILNADIIYVGGGNTFRMMKIWKKLGVDILLKKAYEKGTVMCGLSAGSICWFKYGNSDSRKFNNPNAELIKVSGLNLLNALHCPHYDVEKDRKPDLKKMMKKTSGVVAIAIDNNCAIEIVNDTYKIITSKNTAHTYKVYWKKKEFIEEKINKTEEYQSLGELLKK